MPVAGLRPLCLVAGVAAVAAVVPAQAGASTRSGERAKHRAAKAKAKPRAHGRRCSKRHRCRTTFSLGRLGASRARRGSGRLRSLIQATPPVPSLRAPAAAASPAPRPLPPVVAPQPALPEPLQRFASIRAREYSFALSRSTVDAGRVTLELQNDGEDPHNLVITPTGSGQELAHVDTQPAGEHASLSTDLAAGTYDLYCSLGHHRANGMAATLQVR